MIAIVTDIHHTTSVNCSTPRTIQFPSTLTMPPKHPQELPLSCEDLDTMVASVSHIHLPSAVTGYTTRITKLSLATALLAKGAGEGEVRVQDLNKMIQIVSHIHLVVASVECNVSWTPELQRSTALGTHCCKELTFCCELLNAMVIIISH